MTTIYNDVFPTLQPIPYQKFAHHLFTNSDTLCPFKKAHCDCFRARIGTMTSRNGQAMLWFIATALSLIGRATSAYVPSAGCVGLASVVTRGPDLMDAFVAGSDGRVYTAAWQPGDSAFRGWWRIGNLEVPPCAPISAVSRSANKLDVFATGLDGKVYTAAWQAGDTAFRGWWPVAGGMAQPGAPVGVVSRSSDK